MEHNQAGPVAGTAPQRITDRPLPRPPPSHHSSSEYRRRHTMLEAGRYNTSNQSRYHTQHPLRPDDLAARVLPQFRPRQSSPTMSDLVPNIPLWQPDEEVSKCPVCEQDFSLFFRKHHCRRCGKVVCGDCSRHRITVPVRYVAQPPWAAESALQDAAAALPVRVCNPCVPDPWSPTDDQPPPVPPRDRPHNRYSLPPPPQFTHPGLGHRHSASISHPSAFEPRHTIYATPLPPGGAPGSLDSRLRFSVPAQHPLPKPPPRREVKEEDECPVCGRELPPGDAIREEHISECVTTRFGGESARATPPTQAAAFLEGSSTSPSASNRTRSQSYRSRGLYQYQATEKDCVDGDGDEHECPICFEEFQPGETLGRLECLCRFHHRCIQEWWSIKGPGMCPVHASHE